MASADRRRPLLESPSFLIVLAAIDAAGLLTAFLLMADLKFAQLLLLHVAFFSLVTFLLFGLDKRLAGREKRRVSEWNLHLASACGGAFGAQLGMAVFRHKTQRAAFRILTPILAFVHFVGLVLVLNA